MKMTQGSGDDRSSDAQHSQAPHYAATADDIDASSVPHEGEPLVASLLALPFFQEAPALPKGLLEEDEASLDADDALAPARGLFASFLRLPAFQELVRRPAPHSDTEADAASEPQDHHEPRRRNAQHNADCGADSTERSVRNMTIPHHRSQTARGLDWDLQEHLDKV
jgi:hypothetical protein